MSVIRILAIHPDSELAEGGKRLIAARAHGYQGHDGFEHVELLEPADGRPLWLLVMRWRDEASFDAFFGGGAPYTQAVADRLASLGVPDSFTAEMWSFDIAVDTSL
jgi:heme oxygenase (mycobilin-producing)